MAEKLQKVQVIIDCDPGVDDAVAIMMALSQSSIDLLAITCVAGNTPIDNVLRNALRVITACKRTDVPVYGGSDKPLLNINYEVGIAHGSDGLWGMPDPDPPSLDLVQSEHAVKAMIRLTEEHPGQVTMVAIGPLTNLALAIRLDPGFTGRLKKLVIMGGNTEGYGNITDAAEFNFYTDPEAAHIVMSTVQCPTVVVGWQTCLQHGLPWEWFDKWIARQSPKAVFASGFLKSFSNRMRYTRNVKHFFVCDGLAMAIAIDPSMVVESVHRPVYIELRGTVTRGQMVTVVKNTQGLELGPAVEIVKKCKIETLAAMYEKATD